MDIIVTEYSREDGVSVHRIAEDQWLVRCRYGRVWFWDVAKNDWELHYDPYIPLQSFAMPLNKAMELLAVVKPKRYE